jgi:hypothetical protein
VRAAIRPVVLIATAPAIAMQFVVRMELPITRKDNLVAPVTALAHVPPDLVAQPVFNHYNFGGYLIFKGVKPFIDGRADMYGDAFAKDYFNASKPDRATLATLFRRYGVTWSILPPESPVIPVLDAAGWRRLYADRYAVVQQRPAGGDSLLKTPPKPAR